MFFEESATGTGFEIFFEIPGSWFVGECKVGDEFDWEKGFGSGNITILMPLYSFFEIVGATNIWVSIWTQKNIDVVH